MQYDAIQGILAGRVGVIPRLELRGEEFRIDDTWYPLRGERRIELLKSLLDAPVGEWTVGKALHDKGRVRRTLERLHPEVRAIIEGPRPGVGGYRIKPEYRV